MGLFRKTLLAGATVLAASALTGMAAQANPIYVGYSLDGGMTITQVGGGVEGSNFFSTNAGGFTISGNGTGAPNTAQGTLLTGSLSVASTTSGAINIYVSETGNNLNVASFTTGFANNSISTVSVIETSYVTAGSTPFSGGTMIGQATVAPNTAAPSQTKAAPAGLANNLFTITSVYSIVYGSGGGRTTSSLDVTSNAVGVPEPASMALLGAGLVGLGFFRRRRAN